MNVFTRLSYSRTPPMFAYYVSNAKHTHTHSQTPSNSRIQSTFYAAHTYPNQICNCMRYKYCMLNVAAATATASKRFDVCEPHRCKDTCSVVAQVEIYIYTENFAIPSRCSRAFRRRISSVWYGVTVGGAAAGALLRATHSKMNFTVVCHMNFAVPDYAFLVQNISSFMDTNKRARWRIAAFVPNTFPIRARTCFFIICRSVSDGDDDDDVPVHTFPSHTRCTSMCKTWII